MVIKSVGVLSAAKLLGALYGFGGLIVGAIVTVAALFGASPDTGAFAVLLGVGAIIIIPLFYGIMGFIFGALFTFIFNLLAGFIGGLEIEVE